MYILIAYHPEIIEPGSLIPIEKSKQEIKSFKTLAKTAYTYAEYKMDDERLNNDPWMPLKRYGEPIDPWVLTVVDQNGKFLKSDGNISLFSDPDITKEFEELVEEFIQERKQSLKKNRS